MSILRNLLAKHWLLESLPIKRFSKLIKLFLNFYQNHQQKAQKLLSLRAKRSVGKQFQHQGDYYAITRNDEITLFLRKSCEK